MILSDFPVTTALWFLAIAGKLVVITTLLYRRSWKRYPWFLLYFIVSLAVSLVRFYVAGYHPNYYLRTYYYSGGLSSALLIGVVTEVYAEAFTVARSVFVTWLPTLLRIAGTSATVLALFVLLLPAYQGRPERAVHLMSLDRAITFLALSAFGILALVSSYLGLDWSQRAYGIAVGFLFYLLVDTVVSILVSQFPAYATPILNVISMTAFIGAELVWTYYFTRKEIKKQVASWEQIETAKKAMGTVKQLQVHRVRMA